jgi:hypothetical protein
VKKLFRWSVIPLMALALLAGNVTPASAGNDVWHRAAHYYFYGTNDSVEVELSIHTWDNALPKNLEGNIFVNPTNGNDVRKVTVLSLKLWSCDPSNPTNCDKVDDWPDHPGTFCLADCSNPTVAVATSGGPFTAQNQRDFHTEGVYQFQWSNGNWSTTKDENSNVFTW